MKRKFTQPLNLQQHCLLQTCKNIPKGSSTRFPEILFKVICWCVWTWAHSLLMLQLSFSMVHLFLRPLHASSQPTKYMTSLAWQATKSAAVKAGAATDRFHVSAGKISNGLTRVHQPFDNLGPPSAPCGVRGFCIDLDFYTSKKRFIRCACVPEVWFTPL